MVDAHLLDSIYEAAVVPERWERLLEEICAASGTRGGAVLALAPLTAAAGPRVLRHQAAGAYRGLYARVEQFAQVRNPRFERAIGRHQWFFQPDTALCSLEELENDEAYELFVRPLGLGWTIGCPIPIPSADMIVFDFGRLQEHGPFDDRTTGFFNELRPHLARAAFVAMQLGLERARAAVETLQALALPGAALTASGRVVAANELLTRLSPRIEAGAFDRLVASDVEVARQLRSLFSSRRPLAEMTLSLPVPATGADPALILHFLPLRQAAGDIFSNAQILLVITPVIPTANAPPQVIAGLFDLTPAEMMLATALAAGASLPHYARQRGISYETVRTQLKNLMLKTGTHQQVELVRLLIGAAVFPAP